MKRQFMVNAKTAEELAEMFGVDLEENPEVWEDIGVYNGRDYTGSYQVSNHGRVKRIPGKVNGITVREHFLKLKTDRNGYKIAALSLGGVLKHCKVHRLVMTAFIPNPDPERLTQVNHKDEDKANNTVWLNPDGSVDHERSNLEWCDNAYNLEYGTARDRSAESRKGFHHTEEAKRKMSEARKGKPLKPWSEEKRRKMEQIYAERRGKPGKPWSEETRKKQLKYIDARRGIPRGPMSDETKRKLSEAKKGKPGHPHTEEHKNKMKKPIIMDESVFFSSAKDAAIALGTRGSNITAVAKGQRNLWHGHKFRYANPTDGCS